MATQLWQQEFGAKWNVPQELQALVTRGVLTDQSWHNDACASFSANLPDGEVLWVWVDAEQLDDREYPEHERFVLETRQTADDLDGEQWFLTEDTAVVMRMINGAIDGKIGDCLQCGKWNCKCGGGRA